jgi:hypothetical protein
VMYRPAAFLPSPALGQSFSSSSFLFTKSQEAEEKKIEGRSHSQVHGQHPR